MNITQILKILKVDKYYKYYMIPLVSSICCDLLVTKYFW